MATARWDTLEKTVLVRTLRRNDVGWSAKSIAEEIGTKTEHEVQSFLDALERRVPELFSPEPKNQQEVARNSDDEVEKNGEGEEPEDLYTSRLETGLPPRLPEHVKDRLLIFNIPGLLRHAHREYIPSKDMAIQRDAVVEMYDAYRVWVQRVIRVAVTLCVEAQKYEHRRRVFEEKLASFFVVGRKHVECAVRIVGGVDEEGMDDGKEVGTGDNHEDGQVNDTKNDNKNEEATVRVPEPMDDTISNTSLLLLFDTPSPVRTTTPTQTATPSRTQPASPLPSTPTLTSRHEDHPPTPTLSITHTPKRTPRRQLYEHLRDRRGGFCTACNAFVQSRIRRNLCGRHYELARRATSAFCSECGKNVTGRIVRGLCSTHYNQKVTPKMLLFFFSVLADWFYEVPNPGSTKATENHT
ncbi:hypothetical protein BC832DRAFT_252958 [Gaertneriomyces semiglobifer]|nr:hypothetical protein BC832DRAFT_252958 [Gaertneriomyces semiglobifer]